jgi:hypothetical protein
MPASNRRSSRTTTVIDATRALRRLICRVLIGVFVSAQLAITAHACPAFGPSQPMTKVSAVPTTEMVASMDAHDMSSAEAASSHAGMDGALSSVCVGHCQFGQQMPDQTPAPAVFPALLSSLYALPSLDQASALAAARAASARKGPTAPADPPHAILHCCMRD